MAEENEIQEETDPLLLRWRASAQTREGVDQRPNLGAMFVVAAL
jgi:hypothetical protein